MTKTFNIRSLNFSIHVYRFFNTFIYIWPTFPNFIGIISKLEELEVRILINNPNACSIDYGHQRDTVEFSKV